MTSHASRREFLKRVGALSVAGSAAPLALNLAAIGQASAATASDYKALVCVFLYGGNDYANTVIPYDLASYGKYKGLRPALAVAREELAPTLLTKALPGGRQYALHPSLKSMADLFNAGNMSVMLNIGTLVEPVTKQDWVNRSALLPPKLFSHNDQQSFWQACSPEGASTGWAGRMGDILMDRNRHATFTCINPSNNAVLLAGDKVAQYRISSNGPISINGLQNSLFGSAACARALKTLITGSGTHLMEKELARLTDSAIRSGDEFKSALSSASDLSRLFGTGNSLAAQLRIVASTIATSAAVGAKRQIFFVSLGGFDNHNELLDNHPALLKKVDAAMRAFYEATVQLGVEDKVTTFTGSDFGRSWGNDDGSDHGWGSMHFVMGGAVKGKNFVGTAPVIASDGPDDIGQGRLIPTLAVDQLAATLGKWMGLTDSQLLDVLPNLGNFNTKNLGFMA